MSVRIYLLYLAVPLLLAQSEPADLQQYFERGEKALSERRYADAEQAYEKLKHLSPGTAEVYGRLGLIYFQEGKFEQAVPALRQALKLKPSLPNTDILLAMSLCEVGHYEEALPNLEKGFKRTPDLPLKRMSGLQLLRAYTSLHKDSRAVEIALELNRLFPDDPEILYHASRIYANFAYLNLEKLRQVAPTSVWREQAAAEADESQGNLAQAVSEYRQVLAADPVRRGIHYRIGRALLSQPHAASSEALKEFEQELQLDPTNANAAYEIGEIYRKSGRFDQAREYFGKALQFYPDFEEAQLGLGAVEISTGNPARALPHLEKAAMLNPDDEVSYYRLSQAYKALGNTVEQQKALAHFERLHHRAAAPLTRPQEVTKQEVDANNVP